MPPSLPISGYAPAVVANDFVFAAGAGPDAKDVLGTDPPGGPHYFWSTELPIRRQAESALKKIESTLNAAGTSLANCLKAQVHVAGEENFPDFLDVWNAHVGASPAALTVTPAKAFSAARDHGVDKLHPAQGRRSAQEGDRARGHSADGLVFAGGARRRVRVQPGPAADDARRNGGRSDARRSISRGFACAASSRRIRSTTMPKRSRKPPAPTCAMSCASIIG